MCQYYFKFAKADLAMIPPKENPMKFMDLYVFGDSLICSLTSLATFYPRLYIDWFISSVMD